VIKIDVFDKIDDRSHIESFKQHFHCRDSVIIKTDVTKSSTFKQKMLFSEQTFTMCKFWLIFTRKQIRMCETRVPNL